MKSLTKILVCASVGAMIAVGSAYAGSKLNLFVNGRSYDTSALDIQVKNGKVYVPIDRLAEEFKGKAVYDTKKNEVRVTLPDSAEQAIQISRLESGLLPTTAKEALDTWVEGIQTRNGALQYAVFSPELRASTKKKFEDFYWVTGGSSPHMTSVDHLKTKPLNKTTIQYSFEYGLASSNWKGRGSAVVTVKKFTNEAEENWLITNIKMKNLGDTGITIGIEPFQKK
ncbi:hypothetical protein J2Z69_000979 [Paenibacillus shirakamiensis]|uniref:Copper amine oxidase-like N-terminal domain-containing protein n=1 Tax=Paenibacillus shirakamiensis TaxID=1265935 RepID=A0ABS4JFW5_9BACL|nr:hypothetical protein [Paenibacillus shirakamiensis]MBP1999960.1 hypothetical protein [Paenibacillus shirakamiensis]